MPARGPVTWTTLHRKFHLTADKRTHSVKTVKTAQFTGQAEYSMNQNPAQTIPLPVAAQPPAPPVKPYVIIVKDPQGVEHQIQVNSARLDLTREGNGPPKGSIYLTSVVLPVIAGQPELTLMGITRLIGTYTVTLRYFTPSGQIIRDDTVTVNESSTATYRGPSLSANSQTWEFLETLTIEA